MIGTIKQKISDALFKLYQLEDVDIETYRTEERFGDYASNVALKEAPKLKLQPLKMAEELQTTLSDPELFSEVTVAGPGFINFRLSNKALVKLSSYEPDQPLKGQTIVCEYSDPNPFKVLHAGHLYTSVIGDAIANLLSSSGADVKRVNFGGDVGLHVAKTIWAVLNYLAGDRPEKLEDIEQSDRAQWLSECYVKGNEAYESNDKAKEEIRQLNPKIYELATRQIKDRHTESELARIYWTCRDWSYDYFNDFYNRLGIRFDKYYPESEVADLGVKTVKEHIPDVYKKSQGAIVFDGQKYGLYTNVFINSQGLPTYGAKDVGLIMKKYQDFKYNRSVIITGNDQADYLKVVLKSVSLFADDLVKNTTHIMHGVVKLAGGEKMSSRKGNILLAADILDLAEQAAKDKDLSSDAKVSIGAVKYAFLRQGIGANIIYDAQESVSLEGNSGPYLQYAYARAVSILNKAAGDHKLTPDFTDQERSLLRQIYAYNEALELARAELKPHHLANYLYELAQGFNRFYENNRVVGDERQDLRLALVKLYSQKLANGLKLLGLSPIEHM